MKIFSILGKSDGYAYKNSNISILVPTLDDSLVTPHWKPFNQLLHCLVSHPKLQICDTTW